METEPALIKDYIATGKAKLIYRHLLQLGDRTERAAEASECAADQDLFWQMRYTLYKQQADLYSAGDLDAFLGDTAQSLGADRATFDSCMQQNTHREAVQADNAAARAQGITGRPAFQIGETRLVGSQPIETFARALGE